MLEQINAASEDQHKTHTIVALGMVAFATYTLGDAALHGMSAITATGMMVGTMGGVMLNWIRTRATFATKRFAA